MATVAHHVYSNYNPEVDRERLEIETGQLDAAAQPDFGSESEEDLWLTERPFGSSARVLHPPLFVPATIDYNEWGSASGSKPNRLVEERGQGEDEDSVAGWYKSLARRTPGGTPRSSTPTDTPPAESPAIQEMRPVINKKDTIKRDRNNWFISRVLEASTSASTDNNSSTSTRTPRIPVTRTLADILAQDPPPLPTEERYTPRVWLAIGPSNKGFTMLQKNGWEEGEALGRASRNRSGLGYKGNERASEADLVEEVGRVKQEVIDITFVDDEIIDLTLSDDDDNDTVSRDVFSHPPNQSSTHSLPSLSQHPQPSHTVLDHSPRALLTPLPTVLKSDRLGIGLKAKTTGSGIYRAPVKRVTHSQAAMAAHIRAAEQQKIMKKLVGRGRRGFEKVKKREEEGRRALLSYLNT